MKKILLIILVLMTLTFLTGCSKEENNTDKELMKLKEIEYYEKNLFLVFQNVLGFNINEYQLITRLAKPSYKSNTNGEEKKEIMNEEELITVTDVAPTSSIFNVEMVPNWDEAKKNCEKLQNSFIDILLECKNENVDIKNISTTINELINSVVQENRQDAIMQLKQIYAELPSINEKLITDKKVLLVKNIYCNLLYGIIVFEQNDKNGCEIFIENIEKDLKELKENLNDENTEYIINRIEMLVDQIDIKDIEKNKEINKLKVIMLLECMPILNNYAQEMNK